MVLGGGVSWWTAWARVCLGGVVLCLCYESGFCVDGRSRYLCIVLLCGYLHILGAPSVQSCCTLLISAS